MAERTFKDLADEALSYTSQGLAILVETDELQRAALTMDQNTEFADLVREISGKQKHAVELIQNAMMIQRNLMNRQAESVRQLISSLK